MKNIKSTFKVLRTDVELDFKEISYLVLNLDGKLEGILSQFLPAWALLRP